MARAPAIPVLDGSALSGTAGGSRPQLVEDFGAAYRNTGFSYLVNHGVDQQLIDAVFVASRRFHALSHEDKMTIELNAANRGFLPMNASRDVNTTLAEVKAPNQSESFLAMSEHTPDSPEIRRGDYLAGPNQWPEIEGFAETIMEYHRVMCNLGRAMIRVAAESLGADPGPMVEAFTSPIASVRLLRYPPQPQPVAPGVFGSAPHRDFGFLTFLAQDDVGGLAVRTPQRHWIDVPPIPGAFVVNVGDLLSRWSNGLFISTPHRVLNRSDRARYSVPFFFDAHDSTVVAPLASCVSADRPPRYGSVSVRDHLRSELEAGFRHHRQLRRD